MAVETVSYSNLSAWCRSKSANTANTPYDIILTDTPASWNKSYFSRYVNILAMTPASGVSSIYCEGNTYICSINIGIVTTISSNAFVGCTNLQTVKISIPVTTIESYAFTRCSRLQTVIIGDSVTTIDTGMFGYCSRLNYVEWAKNHPSIPDYTFNGGSKNLTIVFRSDILDDFSSSTFDVSSNNHYTFICFGSLPSYTGLEQAHLLIKTPKSNVNRIQSIVDNSSGGYPSDTEIEALPNKWIRTA